MTAAQSSPTSLAAPLLRVADLAIVHAEADAATPAAASFEVRAGEAVLLLGPSGSGKSTLALALNGLVPQSVPAAVGGTVEVAGQAAFTTPVSQLSTRVAMVFQDPDAQLVTATVFDEVAFGPENLRVPAAEIERRVEAALRRVELWERRDDSPDRLSGGGRQRLAVACALAMRAPLIVLDEPTANLDAQGTADVYAALAEIVDAGDRAIVLIEHNLDEALQVASRVVVLDREGRTIADGPVADVLRERAEEFAALGVWLPTAALAALRLRRAGYPLDPLPLTPRELRAALEATPDRSRSSLRLAAPPLAPGPLDETHASLSERSETKRSSVALPFAASPLAPEPEVHNAVEIRGLTIRRGAITVLDDVSLDVRSGEFLAVAGPNGAGKTTLLHAIAGVVRPPRGAVRAGGLDPARADSRELSRRVGFVFQNPEHQFVTTTVFDEIALGLRRSRLPEQEVRERVDAVLERFALIHRAGAHPFLLSGGEKRRLSVGTALVAGAQLLVLDEPTFGQDRARADELLALLDDLHRAGTTVVIVSHDMQLVAEHADRIAVLAAGRLLALGPTRDILTDDSLLDRAGLGPPPVRAVFADLAAHPDLAGAVRLADLPGGAP